MFFRKKDKEKDNLREVALQRVVKIYPTLKEIEDDMEEDKGSFIPSFLFIVLLLSMIGFVGFVGYDLNFGITGYAVFGGDFKVVQNGIVEGFTASEDMELEINNVVGDININGLKEGDEISVKNVDRFLAPESTTFSKVIAIDHNLAYEDASFTDIGYGVLYKCRYFDFESDLCLSSWEPIREIDGSFEEVLDKSGFAIEGESYKYPRKQIEEFVEVVEVAEEVVEEPKIEEEVEEIVEEVVEEVVEEEVLIAHVEEGGEKIAIIESSCVFKLNKFEVCATASRLGGSYGKIQISGGEGLRQTEKEREPIFSKCERFEAAGSKAVNAYLFDEGDDLIKQDFSTIVRCDEEVTQLDDSESYVRVGYEKGMEEILEGLPEPESVEEEVEIVEEITQVEVSAGEIESDLSCLDRLSSIEKYYFRYLLCNGDCVEQETTTNLFPQIFAKNLGDLQKNTVVLAYKVYGGNFIGCN